MAFQAKLLLFGEYTVLHGSMALSVPLANFNGQFSFPDPCTNEATISNTQLKGFCKYIEEIKDALPFDIDVEKFQADICKGLYFNSNIPEGYGLGSSGALVAAVYATYAYNSLTPRCGNVELSLLRNQLQVLENYFHGSSSGIDPLVSYSGWPIFTREDKSLTRLRGDKLHVNDIHVFLVDTKRFGDTQKNVLNFKQLMNDKEYKSAIYSSLVPQVNNCTSMYLRKDENTLQQISNLSQLQLEYFRSMIPDDFVEHFIHGLQYDKFALKLCGSGGGGFTLGFTNKLEETKNYFSNFEIPFFEL